MRRDFLSYYEEALAKRGLSRGSTTIPSRPASAPARAPEKFTSLWSGEKVAPQGEPLDGVQWVLDLISRGMYGSAQVATNFADESVEATKNVLKGGNFVGEALAGGARAIGKSMAGDDSYSAAFAKNDLDKKRTFSDVIEETTDKGGEAFDRGYVDRIDNVHPFVKGAAGLAGDIFLDPTTYIPGVAFTKPFQIGGKALAKVAKPLGYTGGRAGVALEQAEMQYAKDVGQAQAQGLPIPEAPPGVAQAIAERAASKKVAGAPSVVANSVPVATSAKTGALDFINNLMKGPGAKSADALEAAALKTEAKAATPVAPPKPRTAHREFADAEATLRRTTTATEEVAREKKVNQEWLLSPEGRQASPQGASIVDSRLTSAAEKMMARDEAEAAAKTTPPVSKEQETLDAIKSVGEMGKGFDAISDIMAKNDVAIAAYDAAGKPGDINEWIRNYDHTPQVSPQPVREPLPEGAMTELAAKIDGYANIGTRAKNMAGLADNGMSTDEVKALLDREDIDAHLAAGTTDTLSKTRQAGLKKHKPLDAADRRILEDTRHDAALALHTQQYVRDTTIAVTAADNVPAELVARAGGYADVIDLHEALTQGAHITRIRKFLHALDAQVGKQMQAPLPFQGRLKGTITEVDGQVIGTGIFRPEYDELRASAMHYWLSPDGALAKEYEDDVVELVLPDDSTVKMTVEDMAAHVSALDNPANETMLRNLSSGFDYVAPASLSARDADITRAIWNRFYEDVTGPGTGVTGHGAEKAFHVANALQALQYDLKYQYNLVEKGVGPETAEALAAVFGTGNPQRAIEHFKTLIAIQNPAFSVDDLSRILTKTSVYNVPGTKHSQVKAILTDAGKAKKYAQYERFQALQAERPDIADEALALSRGKRPPKDGQEPTPVEAIPADADPATAAVAATAPSNVSPHHVSPEDARAQKGADSGPKKVWYRAVLDDLLGRFVQTVENPQSLPTTTSGVHVTSSGDDSLGWRTDLWNMPKQAHYINQLSDLMVSTPAVEEALLTGSKYTHLRGNTKTGSGVMPPGPERRAFEERAVLEALDVSDKFLANSGVRQVIGTTAEDAIPLSIGDALHAIVFHTDPLEAKGKKLFGALGPQIRQMMFFGAQFEGAAKVNLTNFAEGLRRHLAGESEEAVKAQLLNGTKLGKRGNPARGEEAVMPNNWVGDVQGDYLFHRPKVEEGATDPWLDIFPNAEYRPSGKTGKGWRLHIPGTDMADVMYRLIDETAEDIGAVAVNNGWRGANAVMEQKDILLSELSKTILGDLARNPEKMPELVHALANLEDAAEGIAAREGMYPAAGKIGAEELGAQVGPDAVREAKDQEVIAASETRNAPPKQNYAERRKAMDRTQTSAAEPIQDQALQNTEDLFATLLNDNPDIDAALKADVPAPPKQDSGLPPRGGGTPHPPAGAAPDPDPALIAHAEAMNTVSDLYDFSAPVHTAYLNVVGRFMFNNAKRFNGALGMPTLWQGLHSGGVLANSYLSRVTDDISKMSAKYDQATLKKAYDSIVSGNANTDPTVIAAAKEIGDKLGLLWGTHGGSTTLGHALLNSDPVVTHLNGMMRKYFPPETSKNSKNKVPQFELDKAAEAMEAAKKAGGNLTLGDALAAQWRSWTVDDPADFLVRMLSAAVNTAEHRAVVALFNRNMKAWGGVSEVPLPGWSRPGASKDSAFIHFIDQTKYYPDELLRELHHADIFASTSKQFANEAGEWVRSNYMPWLNAWKRGHTIHRLGHHVRTQIGDTFLTYTVRGHSMSGKSAMDATRLMAMTNSYEDMDFMAMLNALHEEGGKLRPTGAKAAPKVDDVLFTTKRHGAYTLGQAGNAIHMNGLKPTYHMGEGLYENAEMMNRSTKLANLLALETGPLKRYGDAMGTFSQARDHWTRAQHFMQIMRQEMGDTTGYRKQFAGKWKTVEELEKLAAREVKKYHPDSSMLTPFEAKFMRLLIPFYSWMAKILPAFFESFIRNPGRVSMIPKASYEIAVMTGVNPDSIYDPFPTSQQFPMYIENEALGPQFKDPTGGFMRIDPGIPQLDVLNTFLAPRDEKTGALDIGGILGGMVTPAWKVPAELMTQSQAGGIPVDTSDYSGYFDKQIPGGSYMAGITGRSPTSGFLQETKAVEDEKRQGFFNQNGEISGDAAAQLFNWVTGLGMAGLSHENQINQANIQDRNRAGQ